MTRKHQRSDTAKVPWAGRANFSVSIDTDAADLRFTAHTYLGSRANRRRGETCAWARRFVYFLRRERKDRMTRVVECVFGGCLLLCFLQTYLAGAQEWVVSLWKCPAPLIFDHRLWVWPCSADLYRTANSSPPSGTCLEVSSSAFTCLTFIQSKLPKHQGLVHGDGSALHN